MPSIQLTKPSTRGRIFDLKRECCTQKIDFCTVLFRLKNCTYLLGSFASAVPGCVLGKPEKLPWVSTKMRIRVSRREDHATPPVACCPAPIQTSSSPTCEASEAAVLSYVVDGVEMAAAQPAAGLRTTYTEPHLKRGGFHVCLSLPFSPTHRTVSLGGLHPSLCVYCLCVSPSFGLWF